MAGYKVSYKILKQQGEDMKAAAKLVDDYSDRVAKIVGKLGEDAMLAEVRSNLQKLRSQLTESRVILSTAGELLIKSVDGYGGAETRQVKRVDGMKAHNRDFYKNPIVVASAGVVAGAVVTSTVNTVNTVSSVQYTQNTATDNSVNIVYNTAEPSAASASAVQTAPQSVQTVPAAQFASQPEVSAAASGGAGAAVVAGVAGAAVGAAGVAAAGIIAKKRKDAKDAEAVPKDAYDPEAELDKAIQRVRELEREGIGEE